jgi:hypothetical protein
MATSDYMVGNAPAQASYGAPLVGFQLGQSLANLPQQYFDGAQRARLLAMQNAFPNGLPRQPDGSPDLSQIIDKSAQLDGLQYAGPLLRFMNQQNAATPAPQSGAISTTDGSAGPAWPQTGAASVPSTGIPAFRCASCGLHANPPAALNPKISTKPRTAPHHGVDH